VYFLHTIFILLGHVICKQGLLVDPVNIVVIVDLPHSASTKCQIMKISTRSIEFPTTKMQQHAQELSNIELVLSQLPVNVLHNLQTSVTQEIQLRADSTSMDLSKVNEGNVALHVQYNKLVKE
jgi:hypothetical protein